MVNTKKFPRGIWSWARQYYTNGPLVAGASSLPAKLDQVISCVMTKRRLTSGRAPDPGLMKSQATSKYQAASVKLSNQPVQVSSDKHPNHNHKRQATSLKLQAH